MNGDFEKHRAEHVTALEAQVQHLQRQLNELQAQAHWIPEVNMAMDPTKETARITLAFGGKRVTATFTTPSMMQTTVSEMTAAVIDTFVVNLIADRFREVVEPEIRRAVEGVQSTRGAGQW